MMAESSEIKLEERRLLTTRAQKNLLGLTETFEGADVHENYLNGLEADDFISGLDSLSATFKALYTGMINEPQMYATKDAKVTKPEIYFQILESLGFSVTGLGEKIEKSEIITVEFPDNTYLIAALKAMVEAVSAISKTTPNRGNSYFELLENRVLENYPAIEPKSTMDYVLSKLKSKNREIVGMFCEFIKPFARCNIKGDISWY